MSKKISSDSILAETESSKSTEKIKVGNAILITEEMKNEDMKKRFDIVNEEIKRLLVKNDLEMKALIKEEGPVIVFKDIKKYI